MLARAAIVFARHQLKQLAVCTCSNCIRTQSFATPLLAGRQTQDKQHTKLPKHVPASPSMQHVCTLTPFTCMQAYGIRARTRTRSQMSVQFGNLGAVVLCAMVQWLNVCALPIILNLLTWQLCAMTRCMQCMHVHMCKLQRRSKPSIRHLATSPCIGIRRLRATPRMPRMMRRMPRINYARRQPRRMQKICHSERIGSSFWNSNPAHRVITIGSLLLSPCTFLDSCNC